MFILSSRRLFNRINWAKSWKVSSVLSIGAFLILSQGCAKMHPSIVSPRSPAIPAADNFYKIYLPDVDAYNKAVEGNPGVPCGAAGGTPGVAARLAFCSPPAGGTAGSALSGVIVQVLDASGRVTPSATNSIVISSTPPTGFGGTTTSNAVAGVATFNNLMFSTVGTYTLTAAASGLASVTSNSLTVVAAGVALPTADLERARYFRNKIAYNFMGDIDYVYGKYTGGLFTAKAIEGLAADFESLGLTAASAISLATRTKTILAALATGVAGVNLSADKNFFGQQTFQALTIAMQARRDQTRATITQNLQLSVTDYPLAAVRRDLISYFYAGTLPGALQEIQEEAAKTSDDATKNATASPSNPPAAPSNKPSLAHTH
jgi:hypothetical protein